MEWLGGFILGFIAELFRSIFLPASTNWLNRWIPSARKKANLEENTLILDLMLKLKELGKDPELGEYACRDVDKFAALLKNQTEVFIESKIEVIDSTHMTQAEMNMEAMRRADVARQQMERATVALERSNWLNQGQSIILKETQRYWERYAQSHASFVAAKFEGGSMAPLIFASTLELTTVSRTGELRLILEEMRKCNAN